jgi:preprotein translocase SecF subunit
MNVLKNRFVYYSISWILLIVSFWVFLFWKPNYSIDMTWWINMEYMYENSVNIEDLKEPIWNEAKKLIFEWKEVINNIWIYSITWEKAFSIVAWFDTSIDEETLDNLKLEFRWNVLNLLKTQDSSIVEAKYINIWKTFGDYIKNTAFLTLFISAISITIYIWYAFSGAISWINSFSFSIITLLTLVHDVVISAWIYIIFWYFLNDFQIDTFFVTALLTILWYSINNTIVIFDRVRLNLKEYWWKAWKNWKNLYEIVNASVNDTLKRSIYTSLTLFFVLFTTFLFWPETLSGFIFIMMVWTMIWAYSSIFISSQLLYEINKNKKLQVYKKSEHRVEDKIVV